MNTFDFVFEEFCVETGRGCFYFDMKEMKHLKEIVEAIKAEARG